jgi:hypothetical protein
LDSNSGGLKKMMINGVNFAEGWPDTETWATLTQHEKMQLWFDCHRRGVEKLPPDKVPEDRMGIYRFVFLHTRTVSELKEMIQKGDLWAYRRLVRMVDHGSFQIETKDKRRKLQRFLSKYGS